MKVMELIHELSKYDGNSEVRIFAKCKNKSIGISQLLRYNNDVMIYFDEDNEKELFDIRP